MYDMCFACGRDNPISLGLDFQVSGNNRVEAEFKPGQNHQGYEGIVHGGIVSTLLDEAMVTAIIESGYEAYTAELRVRFREEIKVDEELKIRGYILDKKSRLVFTEAEVCDLGGKVKARAEGKFMINRN
ncbi:MAG: PaaI family thioesterase [Halanaerobiaceae bacterium]